MLKLANSRSFNEMLHLMSTDNINDDVVPISLIMTTLLKAILDQMKRRSLEDDEDDKSLNWRTKLANEESITLGTWQIILRKLLYEKAKKEFIPENGKALNVSLLEHCKRIMISILSYSQSHLFLQPVDNTVPGLEDYYSVIKHPMDIGTITERLMSGYYELSPDINPTTFYIPGFGDDASTLLSMSQKDFTTDPRTLVDTLPTETKNMGPEGFAADVRRVWRNCKQYNDYGTTVYNIAGRFVTKFQNLWENKMLPVLRPHLHGLNKEHKEELLRLKREKEEEEEGDRDDDDDDEDDEEETKERKGMARKERKSTKVKVVEKVDPYDFYTDEDLVSLYGFTLDEILLALGKSDFTELEPKMRVFVTEFLINEVR